MFSSYEQKLIKSTTVTADKNPTYDTSPGNNTKDKVFLLSINEVNKYFSSNEARKCASTEYANAQGAYKNGFYSVDGKATCRWWLRSPGFNPDNAAHVNFSGYIDHHSHSVHSDDVAVRPALWIDVKS